MFNKQFENLENISMCSLYVWLNKNIDLFIEVGGGGINYYVIIRFSNVVYSGVLFF